MTTGPGSEAVKSLLLTPVERDRPSEDPPQGEFRRKHSVADRGLDSGRKKGELTPGPDEGILMPGVAGDL